MAEKRMFSKAIIDSDAFLDMPLSTQALYFHLSMRADDDGFISNPKKILRMVGAADDEIKVLITKRFVLEFESGVIVIKHWRIHNCIQKDRYKPSVYTEEKKQLLLKSNNAYTMDTVCIQDVSGMETQIRLDKIRLDKNSISVDEPQKKTIPPLLDDVKAYCKERNNNVDAEKWYDHYTSNGWMVGKNKMKDWKAAVRTWERGSNEKKNDGYNAKPFEF